MIPAREMITLCAIFMSLHACAQRCRHVLLLLSSCLSTRRKYLLLFLSLLQCGCLMCHCLCLWLPQCGCLIYHYLLVCLLSCLYTSQCRTLLKAAGIVLAVPTSFWVFPRQETIPRPDGGGQEKKRNNGCSKRSSFWSSEWQGQSNYLSCRPECSLRKQLKEALTEAYAKLCHTMPYRFWPPQPMELSQAAQVQAGFEGRILTAWFGRFFSPCSLYTGRNWQRAPHILVTFCLAIPKQHIPSPRAMKFPSASLNSSNWHQTLRMLSFQLWDWPSSHAVYYLRGTISWRIEYRGYDAADSFSSLKKTIMHETVSTQQQKRCQDSENTPGFEDFATICQWLTHKDSRSRWPLKAE